MKRILTSSGKILDLEREGDVDRLPSDGVSISSHTYGNSQNPYFFDRRTKMELEQFDKNFPHSIDWTVGQYGSYEKVVVKIFPEFDGIRHEVHLVYSSIHPDDEIDAFVVYPRLDHSYMGHHWYSDDRICYIDNWNRSWTILKVAVQVMCWLTDYYNEKNHREMRYYGRRPFRF